MTLLTLFAAPPTYSPPGLAPVLTGVADTFRPTRVVEEGGDRLHFRVDATTASDFPVWRSGQRPIHEILAEDGDDSYMRIRGTWSTRPYVTLKLDGMKRPHLGAGILRMRIRHRVINGTFSDIPRVCLVDHAVRGKEWPTRVPGAGRFDRDMQVKRVYPTAAWSWQEIDLDHDIVHGWQSNDGIRNFGDFGIKVIAPAGPSQDNTEWQVSELQLLMNPVHPGEGEAAHWGVRPPSRSAPGQGWAVVDYDATPRATQTIQVGREFYTAVDDGGPVSGFPLDNRGDAQGTRHVVADAINRAYYDVTSPGGSGWRIVEIEEMVPFHLGGGEQIYDWNIQGSNSNDSNGRKAGHWRNATSYNATTGVVTGAGEFVRVDKLVVRSAIREATAATYPEYKNERAHISCPASGDSMQFQFFANNSPVDGGHIAYVGLRIYKLASGLIPIQTTFDRGSDTATYGVYDCDFCGTNTTNPDREFKSAMRCGQHAVEAMDCRMATADEHFVYHGGSRTMPSAVIRCRNMTSTQFYPNHPSPDLTFSPNGRMGRTMHQEVSRTNPLDSSGEGNESGAETLDEDTIQFNMTGNPSTFTMAGHLGAYTNRRCATFNPNLTNGNSTGSPIICWTDGVNGGQSNQPKGHHNSIGQFDGPENQFNVPPPPIVPQHYPECGSVYDNGDVVVEDWALGFPAAGSPSNNLPFRFGGCKSVTIRRGNFGGYRIPTIADMPHGTSNTWSDSGAGMHHSLAFTLDGFDGEGPASGYSGWANNSPGAAKVRFGNPASTINPARLAGGGVAAGNADLEDKASDYASATAKQFYLGVDELAAPSTTWPPWPQTNSQNLSAFPCGRVYPGMRKPIITLPNAPIPGAPGGNNPSTIPWPGNNIFRPLSAVMSVTAPTPGGGTSGIVHRSVTIGGVSSFAATATGIGTASASVTMAGTSSMSILPAGKTAVTIAGTSGMSILAYPKGGGTSRSNFFAPSAGGFSQSQSAASTVQFAGSAAASVTYG